jgi:hypothetical protein
MGCASSVEAKHLTELLFADESKINLKFSNEECVFIVVVGNVSLMVV